MLKLLLQDVATRRQHFLILSLDSGGKVHVLMLGTKWKWNVAEQSLRAILCLLKGSPSHAALPHLCIINPFKSMLPGWCPLPLKHSKERVAGEKPPMETYRAQKTFQTSSLKGVLILGNEAWISYERQARLWRCQFHPERPNRAATSENLLEYLSDQHQH